MGAETISQVHGFQGEIKKIPDNFEYNMNFLQSFGELNHRPLLVDLTVEEQTRLKVIYGSADGFHAVDLDSATVYDIYLPKHVRNFHELTRKFANFPPIDSRTNLSALHRHIAQLQRHESPLVLRQRRRLCEHDGSSVEELCAAMG